MATSLHAIRHPMLAIGDKASHCVSATSGATGAILIPKGHFIAFDTPPFLLVICRFNR